MTRVAVEEAYAQAIFHHYIRTSEKGLAYGLAGLSRATVQAKPCLFFDADRLENDDPVLYVFDVNKQGKTVGEIAICGSTYFGSTFAFMRSKSHAARLGASIKKVTGLLRKHGAKGPLTPVVYSYPKVGLLGQTADGPIIVDLYSGGPFSATLASDPANVAGRVVWSFWGEFPQAGGGEKAWAAESKFISRAQRLQSTKPSGMRAITSASQKRTNLENYLALNPPVQKTDILPIPLVGQINDHYCAVATLLMMYKYVYGADLAPGDVAGRMNMTPSGASLDGQLRAFNHFFGGEFIAAHDLSPSFAEVESSLSQYLPIVSGIRGHVRVCIGVRRDQFVDSKSGIVQMVQEYCCVNDPEPIGKGAVVQENIKTAGLVNFIRLTRRVKGELVRASKRN